MMKEILGSALGGAAAAGIALYAAAPARESTLAPRPVTMPVAIEAGLTAPAPAQDLVYYQPRSVAAAPAPVVYVPAPAAPAATAAPARERVVYRDRSDHVERDERTEKRSVAKTAMIIGGSAGAGAGIGGLAGGKKGALIGAAIGGGGAAIYEAVKR